MMNGIIDYAGLIVFQTKCTSLLFCYLESEQFDLFIAYEKYNELIRLIVMYGLCVRDASRHSDGSTCS